LKSHLTLALKITISVALLGFLFTQLDWSALASKAGNLAWWTLPLAVSVLLLAYYIICTRWAVLLRTHHPHYRTASLFRPFLVATWFNNIMPSATGGDLIRSYYIYRYNRDAVSALSPVITERVIGLFVLLAINVLAIAATQSVKVVTPALWTLLTMLLMAMLVGLLLVAIPQTYWPLHRLLERMSRFRAIAFLLRLGEATHGYLKRPGVMLKVILSTIVGQLLAITIYQILAIGLELQVPFDVMLVVVPLALMASALPISIGGMGVRELAAVGLFTRFGVDATDAAAIALIFIPVVILASLPGLYYYLRYKDSRLLAQSAGDSVISSR
jgi:uncharacterized protein (TIRG00374 family)